MWGGNFHFGECETALLAKMFPASWGEAKMDLGDVKGILVL